MASCEVFVDTVRAGSTGGTGAFLAHAWVYLRHGMGSVEVFRTDGRGMMLSRVDDGTPLDHWWEYTSPYRATVGETVRLCFSRGARPVPMSELVDAVFVERRLVNRRGQRRGRLAPSPDGTSPRLNTVRLSEVVVTLPDPEIHLESPAELSVWAITQQPLPLGDPYYTDQLSQGRAVWNGARLAEPEFDPNMASHTLEACRAQAPRVDIPARGLRVQGRVGLGVTRAVVRLLDARGGVVPLRRASDFAAVLELEATVAAGTFQADFLLEDGLTSDGAPLDDHLGLVSLCLATTGNGEYCEAFTGLLCAVQAGMVDDHRETGELDQSGVSRGGADEWRVVDFIRPNAPNRQALLDLTRTQRMHAYELHLRQRVPGNAQSTRQEMPLWMVEIQMLGLRPASLGELMMRRYFRESGGIIVPHFGSDPRQTVSLRVSWGYTLRLTWPARNRALTEPYEVRQQAAASLEFDHRGRLLDSSGAPVADTVRALPFGAEVSPLPLPGRRVPTIRLSEARRWGRHRPGAEIPGMIFESQPVLVAGGQEVLRGGFGTLEFESVDIGYTGIGTGVTERHGVAAAAVERQPTSTDPDGILASRLGGTASVVEAGTPPLALPAFRLGGRNLGRTDARNILESLVRERIPATGQLTLTQDCWVATAELVILPEGGTAMFNWPATRDPNTNTRVHADTSFGFFGLEAGMPLFGPPNGYGMCQLDPPTNQDQFWDYRANMNEGLTRLLNAARAARARFARGGHYAAVARPATTDPAAPIGSGNGSARAGMFDHVSAQNAWNRIADTQRGRAMIQREAIRAYGGGFEFTYFAGAGPDGAAASGDNWQIWSTPHERFWEVHVDAKLRRAMRATYPAPADTQRSRDPGTEGQLTYTAAMFGPGTDMAGAP